MAFPYKHVLIIGATSGIGAAMASHLVAHGVKVTAVGRREERLNDFVSKHGSELASSQVFDISELDKIPAFTESVTAKHPAIDALFLNAGIQRRYDFTSPNLDLPQFDREVTTNFTSFVHLTASFLPFLISRQTPTGILFTGTHISLVPAFPLPAYSASKAALDAFIVCMREQLSSTNVKVTHISAPPVQTEIHDSEMGAERGRKFGMPVEQFTAEVYGELVQGVENIVVGTVGGSEKRHVLEIMTAREGAVQRLNDLLKNF